MQASHSPSGSIPANNTPSQLTAHDAPANHKVAEHQTDFVWRFALEPPAEKTGYDDPLIEMVRVLLKDFLDMGFVTFCGKRVRINGFAFNNQPERVYEIFLDEDHPHVKPEATSR